MAALFNCRNINRISTGLPSENSRGSINASLLLLAGGQGSRMGGKNKLYLEIGGVLLLERILTRISFLFHEIVLLVGPGEVRAAEKYLAGLINKWGIILIEDRHYGHGPLEGLYRGLTCMKEEWGFLLGCDMPVPQEKVIRAMYNFCSCYTDAVAAEIGGYIEPLHAFYRRSCKMPVDAALAREDRKIKQFYDDIRLTIVKEDILREYKNYSDSFFNLNTPHDLAKIGLSEKAAYE